MRRLMILLLIAGAVAIPAYAGGRRGQQSPPRLFEPSEHADLRGKAELLFRWGSEGGSSQISDYQFKLYKGTQTVEAGLIKAETVPSRLDRLSLPADLFENGQTYTWQIRGTGAAKTRPAYTNFKVEK
jgi:hypothetical protein